MPSLLELIIAVSVVAILFWLMLGNPKSGSLSNSDGNELLDANDTRQLATLMGLAGGDIADAALAKFAIQRFQEQYGRAPNTRDIATVVAMIRSM